MTKKARAIQQPKKKKTPHYVPKIKKKKKPTCSPCNSPDSIFGLKPSWRVGLLDIDGNWGWGKIESKKKLLEVMEKLKYFESMTWGEIEKQRSCHSWRIDELQIKLQDILNRKKIDAEDQGTLYQLSLSGPERILGIREGGFFYILLWDPDHSMCPVPKKHT